MPKALMPPAPTPPAKRAPAGAVDSHLHLLGDEYPLWDGRVEDPADEASLDGWLDRYRAEMSNLGFSRCVIVHSILYGADNSMTLEAVRRMGPASRGVGLLKDGATDKEMEAFATSQMVAVRLNYVHGGVLSWAGAKKMAPALAHHGLHIQMLLHSHMHMAEIADDIRALPVPLVIDHLGWPDLSLGVDDPGFQTLLELLSEGRVHLKLSALYRLCHAPFEDATPFVKAAMKANPDALLWGTDWPFLMLADAAQPSASTLLDAFDRACPDECTREKVLVSNPARLFGFDA
ncbi:MAG: amidohydrolase family protein [Rhodobacteraceae bacterium]|nr:amidohydrolase family protein [Paracoccaceae bacterium]